MNRHERVFAALEGKPVDRVPVSAWGHFYDKEKTAESLAEVMLSFHEQYDWDFLKIHARASYPVEDWGCTFRQSGKPGDPPRCTGYPVHAAEDWDKLRPLPPDQGVLGEILRAVKLIRKGLQDHTPLIMTVFSPLEVAHKLVDRDTEMIKLYIKEDLDALNRGLAVIAETFAGFVKRLTSVGVDGIYFSTKWANDGKMTAQEYRQLAQLHDMVVLNAARDLPFKILHLCESRVHLKAMADYPVQVIHWDMHLKGNPNLAEGKNMVTPAVAGGLSPGLLARGNADEVKAQVRQALIQTNGRCFLLSPGCSVRIAETPNENLRAVKTAAEEGFS